MTRGSLHVSVYVSPDRYARRVHYLDPVGDDGWQFRCMPTIPVGTVEEREDAVTCADCLDPKKSPQPHEDTTAPGTGAAPHGRGEGHDGPPVTRDGGISGQDDRHTMEDGR